MTLSRVIPQTAAAQIARLRRSLEAPQETPVGANNAELVPEGGIELPTPAENK